MTPPNGPQSPAHEVPAAQLQEIQSQLEGITRQLNVLGRERANLLGRLKSASGEESSLLQQQIAALDGNIAEAQGQLSEVVGKLAQAKVEQVFGNMEVPPVPPPFLPGNNTPYGIDPDAFTAAFLILAIGVIVPLSVGLTRRLWRRPAPAAPAPDAETVSKARFDRLEQAVDAIAIEIERISEGQRFVTRVLSERPTNMRPAGQAADAKEAALGEAKPFLALGAGPVEAIPIAQRQGVKQSITPH